MAEKRTDIQPQGFPAEFNELCGKESVADVAMRVFGEMRASVSDFTPEKIAEMRRQLNLTQSAMAMLLNTSVSTIQKWEIGAKKPGGTARRLLQVLESRRLKSLL